MTQTVEARQSLPVRFLHLSKRARVACETLDIQTVADALHCSAEEFQAVPNCGAKTFQAFDSTVRAFLADADDRVDFTDTDRFADELRDHSDTPLVRALERGGITTVGEFLTTPRAVLLQIRDVREEACEKLLQLLMRSERTALMMLPSRLLELPLAEIFVPDDVRLALQQNGVSNVSELLRNSDAIVAIVGVTGARAIRAEIERVMRDGSELFEHRTASDRGTFAAFLRCLTACLDEDQRTMFERRVGLGCRSESRWQYSAKWRIKESVVAEQERELLSEITRHAGDLLRRLFHEVEAEFETFDGVLLADNLAPGTLLFSAASEFNDSDLPLRLAAFLFPDRLFHHGSFVSSMRPDSFEALVRNLRRSTRKSVLPRPVVDVRQELIELGCEAPNDLITHVARHHLQRAIEIDPEFGEVFTVRTSTVTERLQLLLDEADRPAKLSDLLFAYRDRYRRVHHNVLRSNLRMDGRFLEVEPDAWSLRERHLDELELARVEAARISTVIRTVGGRHSVAELAEVTAYSDRQVFLISDILRHDPCVRDLGRGEFCPRFQENSQVMSELMAQLRRAAGEIPVSRFLDNQPPHRRRLVQTLLRRNRRFVEPTKDRVDLLSNYLYDGDRIRRLTIVVEQCLEEFGGYGDIERVLASVQDAGLGGSFLTSKLLLDLLRRHGRFEFLPGGILAKASLGLTGWIQQQAREAIRRAGESLSSDEVVIERPELAEFGHCLRELLDRDPLLLRLSDDRYRVA